MDSLTNSAELMVTLTLTVQEPTNTSYVVMGYSLNCEIMVNTPGSNINLMVFCTQHSVSTLLARQRYTNYLIFLQLFR